MAANFHPLPAHKFPADLRAPVARLNRELRDLFALESVNVSEVATSRSDGSVVKRQGAQVHVTRITPDVTAILSATDGGLTRENSLGPAPSKPVFKILAKDDGDELYVSAKTSSDVWEWGFMFKFP